MNNTVRAILWKENKVFITSIFPLCVMYFLMIIVVFDNTVKTLMNNNSDPIFLILYMVLLTTVVVVIIGCMTFNMSIDIDIKDKTLEPLLALTNKPEDIWISKVLFSSLIGIVFGFCGDVIFIVRINSIVCSFDIFHIAKLILFY